MFGYRFVINFLYIFSTKLFAVACVPQGRESAKGWTEKNKKCEKKRMIKSLIRRMKWSGFSITASLL